jgi:serine/threonine protein kinase
MVAIKSLRAELLSDKSFVARFRGEAKNLALLSHPNITTLYTLLEEGGSLYMVYQQQKEALARLYQGGTFAAVGIRGIP